MEFIEVLMINGRPGVVVDLSSFSSTDNSVVIYVRDRETGEIISESGMRVNFDLLVQPNSSLAFSAIMFGASEG